MHHGGDAWSAWFANLSCQPPYHFWMPKYDIKQECCQTWAARLVLYWTFNTSVDELSVDFFYSQFLALLIWKLWKSLSVLIHCCKWLKTGVAHSCFVHKNCIDWNFFPWLEMTARVIDEQKMILLLSIVIIRQTLSIAVWLSGFSRSMML